MRRIQRWQLGVIAFCVSSCQIISGLDDLEATRKMNNSELGTGDAGEAGRSGRDGGDDDSGASPAGSGGSPAAGRAADSGNGGMSGGGDTGAGAGGETAPPCTPPVPGGACDPVAQCGCAGNDNCVFFEDKLACVAPGRVQPYFACSGAADCTKGHQCVGGVCVKPCASSADDACTQDGGTCVRVGFNGTPVPGNYACTRNCNPAHPDLDDARFDACGSGLGCTTVGNHSDCIPSTPRASAGESCKGDGDCAPGFYCSVSFVCEQWCEVGGKDCSSGAQCTGFSDKASAGSVEFGVCCSPPSGKGSCDTSPQCGCARGQRCDFVFANGEADGSTACVSEGGVPPYGACTSQASCGKGYSCTDKACRQLCDLTRINSCASYSEFSRCLPVQVQGKDVPGWGVCSQVCNPAAPFKTNDKVFTACVTGTSCKHLGNGETNCLPLANPNMPGGKTGMSCDSGGGTADGTLCGPGYFCDIGSLTCAQYCEVGAAGACPNDGPCIAFSSPAVKIATISLGYCQ